MRKKLSIIIATIYSNRRDANLTKILAICTSELQGLDFEIIIVNNGAEKLRTNTLARFTQDIKAKRIVLIQENRPDLTIARNIGIKNSKGKYIYFLDDDVEILPGYFHLILDVFRKHDDCLCVGGKVVVKEKSQIEKFTDPFYYRFLSPPDFPESLTKISAPYYVAGASMTFKKEAFDLFGTFNEKLGRKKGTLLSNEDSEMVMRIPIENTYIEPKAVVVTSIDISKLSNTYFIRRFFWQGVSDGIMLAGERPLPYYDLRELSLRKGLMSLLIGEAATLNFNKFLCSAARYIGFCFYGLFAKMYL